MEKLTKKEIAILSGIKNTDEKKINLGYHIHLIYCYDLFFSSSAGCHKRFQIHETVIFPKKKGDI